MPCSLTTGYNYNGCKGGAGGIQEVLLCEQANLDLTAGGTFNAAAGIVTAFTLPTGKQYRSWKLDKEMGLFTDPGTYTRASGTISYAPMVEFSTKKITSTIIQEMHLTAQNVCSVIVIDVNKDAWLFGYGRGMDLMTWGPESGTAITDFNGSKMHFEGLEIAPIYKVTSSLIPSLIIPAV